MKANMDYSRAPVERDAPVIRSKHLGPSRVLYVRAGLHYIPSNKVPYFSITGEEVRTIRGKSEVVCCGCMHEDILTHWPGLADLIRMHLSDINGIPMHAVENGWYLLAGVLPGNAGEKYHGGSQKMNFLKPVDRRIGEWDTTEYREPTMDESLKMFADHVRISFEEALQLSASVEQKWENTRNMLEPKVSLDPDFSIAYSKASWTSARQWFGQWIRDQHSRWYEEACRVICKYGLQVYPVG